MRSHLRLHHVRPAQSHLVHEAVDSHSAFSLQLLQQHVQSDDGARPAHSSTKGGTHSKREALRVQV